MKKAFLTCCLAAILVLGTSAPGRTQGNIRIGDKFTLPLGMDLETVFDDNIYLGSGDNFPTEKEVSDTILHIKPNVGLNYEMPERGNIFVGYEGDWANYSKESENNWKTNKGLFDLNYQAPGGLLLGANNVYADAEDPYGDATQFGLGQPLTKRWYDDFKSKVGWNFGNTTRAMALFNYYIQEYDQEIDKTQDHEDYEIGAGVEYKGLAKTWAFVRYHYGNVDWTGRPASLPGLNDTNDADYTYHRINVGLTWDPGSKVSGELNLGYQFNSFDNETDVNGNEYTDDDTWIAKTVINWQVYENTLLFGSLMRAYRVTGAFSNEYFTDTGISLGVRHRFYTKFTAEALASYFRNEYNTNDRDDDNYELYAKLGYDVREWFNIAASWYYREKDSSSNLPNPDYNDYKNNQIALIASFQF